jgi:2',3'-cyclic-nucleotide 2'-phosphodiesterase (5'-nucleotidase family)
VATTEVAAMAMADLLGVAPEAPAAVTEIYEALQATDLIQDQFQVVAETSAVLNGQRADVRSRETNLGRLAADSTLWYARQIYPELAVDAALKNGGGIRAPILGPNVTKLSVGSALAFDNNLAIVELTGSELLAVMENGFSRVPALDGRFPQVAGMYVEYNPEREGISDQLTLDTPSRVKTLVVTRADGTEDTLIDEYAVVGDPNRAFVLATNDFLLTGGDGYRALADASETRGAERPALGERQVLIDYIAEELGGVVGLPEPLTDPRVVAVSD